MSRLNEFKELEKALLKKHEKKVENQLVLTCEDFNEGKFSAGAYNRIKDECEYMPPKEKIEIIIPKGFTAGFKDSVESMAAEELLHIKKERSRAIIASLVCLLVAAVLLISGQFIDIKLLNEITLIAAWVFAWTAIEKWVFDNGKLRVRRFKILKILSAEITEK